MPIDPDPESPSSQPTTEADNDPVPGLQKPLSYYYSLTHVHHYINCGGGEYTDSAGHTWISDAGFYNAGKSFSVSQPIAGTDADPLFQTERWDKPASPELIYSIPVPAGEYRVRLYFSENYGATSQVGRRVFDVLVEGGVVLDDYDIFARAGALTAISEEFHVVVADDALTIEFRHGVENPKIAAIEVETISVTPPLIIDGGASIDLEVALNSRCDDADNTMTLRVVDQGATAPVLTWSIETAPAAGTAEIIGPESGGSVRICYEPARFKVGNDPFVVKVENSAGESDAIVVNASVSGALPVLSISEPADGSTVNGDRVTVRWATSGDLRDVDHVELRLDADTPVMTAQLTGAYTFVGVAAGSHRVTARLFDSSGLQIPVSGSVASIDFGTQIVVLPAPPAIAILSPGNGSLLTDGTVHVTWTTSGDLTLVDHIHLRLDGGPHVTVHDLAGSYDFTGLGSGAHTISAQLAGADHMTLQNPEAAAAASFTVQLPAAPAMSVTPTSVDFGFILVGATATPTAVQIENTGQTPLTIESLNLTGAHASDFTISSPALPMTVAIGATQTMSVHFTPSVEGVRAATLSVKASEISEVQSIPLAGIGFQMSTGGEVLYRINCGGPAYTDGDGNTWSADAGYYNVGSTFSTNDPIANTTLDPLYQSERWDKPAAPEMMYTFPVDDGSYEVRLHLAEIYGALQQPGRRVFDVKAEGQLVIDNLDVFARGGGDTAHVETFTIDVTDGSLNVEFVHGVENPAINAIEVRRSGGSAALLASPATIEWGHVAIGQSGGARNLQLFNNGSAPAVISSLAFLVNSGAGHEYRATLGGMTFVGDHADIAFSTNVVVGPGQSLVLPVEFVPSEQEEHDVTLEVIGNFPTQRIRLLGIGGANPGHPFLHVVITAPDVAVDYDLDGRETIALKGSDSHTHELGHVLARYEWRENGQLLSTDVNPALEFSVGEHTISLTIFDDNVPEESLTDVATFKVVAPNAVPGALALYYPGGGGGAASLLDNVPANAAFGEMVSTMRLSANGQTIGTSGISSNVMVRLLGQVDLLVGGTYAFSATGGSSRRLLVDGTAVTGARVLSAGRHTVEARFAVASISDAPLAVQYSAGSESPIDLPAGLVTHDESTIRPVMNTMPTGGGAAGGEQIEIRGLGFFPSSGVKVRWGSQLMTGGALVVTPTSIQLNAPSGSGTVNVTVETPAGSSNARTYTYSTSGPAPVVFTLSDLVTSGVNAPTTADWGSDGRFYVGTIDGIIKAYTFDDQYNIIATQTINTLSTLSNRYILGIAMNPLDGPGAVRLYVAHSQIYANGGTCFTGFSPYSGQVSVLTGPNFDTVQPLITGLPVSNHDHAVNGMQFDNNGDLYICIGGNTNAGVEHCNLGALPESPLTAAVIRARTSKPNFNGQVTYRRTLDGSTTNDQVNGGVVDLASNVDLEILASGLRNPYDIVFTTRGLFYATDNGPNGGFGAASTSANTQTNDPTAGDELNLIEEGHYYGHPNRNRGRYDDRQNVYRNATAPSITGHFTQMLTNLAASTDGITEYRANTFNGAMRGELLAQKWNGQTYRIALASNGRSVAIKQDLPTAMSSLDVVTGPGGVVIGVNYTGNKLSIARPQDTAGLAVYDIFPWRAPAAGGRSFVIGGNGFVTPANTTVTIGGLPATLTSVSATRIRGTIPANATPSAGMVDVVVNVNGNSNVLTSAFRYLTPGSASANGAAAYFLADAGGSISDSSTYAPSSFMIRNDSAQNRKISQVRIDLSSAMLRDMVFDPNGTAGDSASKPFSANQEGGTGLVDHELAGAHDSGFDVLAINFSDFDPGEMFTFSIDVDPTSIQGSSPGGPHESGAVSGLELAGARITVVFDNGATLSSRLFAVAGSNTGAEAALTSGAPNPPTIQALGLPISPSTTSTATQTVRVHGAVGSTVRLLRLEGGLFLDGVPGGGFDIDPYESNTILDAVQLSGVVGAGGFVDIPVTLGKSETGGGLNALAAVAQDGSGRTSTISNVVVIRRSN